MNADIDVVKIGVECSEKWKKEPLHYKRCSCIDEDSGTFVFDAFLGVDKNIEPSVTEGDHKLMEALRDHGYAIIDLPTEFTDKLLKLYDQVHHSLYDLDDSVKKKLAKIFRKSNIYKNYFSYGIFPGPGKETWRMRAMREDGSEPILIGSNSVPQLQSLFDCSYDVANELHHLGLNCLLSLSRSMEPELPHNFFYNIAEKAMDATYDKVTPFSLSHINLLRYFDSTKSTPVNAHTDQYLVTLLPLNTSSPALEIWDFKLKKWIQIEEIEKSKETKKFTKACVLTGETFSKLTNDYVVPGLHRVV
eukprot:TRINITY_DN4119_c0_g2_i2.p1 TRINITY_DN4119_c0_g2~~TRINITY_DN4119_c0_g2_i2.p1  ORF type:complete len:304 (+),score=51.36 TRINITY_DN4119_c0_g2_i2:17-928(+)